MRTLKAVTADILAAEDLLNYLVLDNAYIAVGGTQNVVANIGNEDLAISGGRLLYHRVSDGAAYEMAATGTDGNGLRFSETFADESRTGEYIWTLSFMRKMVRNIRLIYLMQEWTLGLVSIQK